MDITKYPYAKRYQNKEDGGYANGILLQDGSMYSFVIFSDEDTMLTTSTKTYESLPDFEAEWEEEPHDRYLLLEGEAANIFKRWQANGYYSPSKGSVDNLVDYANKLGEYATSLEHLLTNLALEKLGVTDIPTRPKFVEYIEENAEE